MYFSWQVYNRYVSPSPLSLPSFPSPSNTSLPSTHRFLRLHPYAF